MKNTGECICPRSPDSAMAEARRMQISWPPIGSEEKHFMLILDHRCPHHGEKVQPAVWGRHRELELFVTGRQWQSLCVTNEGKE